MRLVHRSVATVVVGAGVLAGTVAGTIAVAAPVGAAPVSSAHVSHLAHARTDWIEGDRAAAADEGRYWQAARRELGHYGSRYAVERQALDTLDAIPLTDTTPAQRADAARVTRSLNLFFRTSGLYGVAPTSTHLEKARAVWVTSSEVASAERGRYLSAAVAELSHYGSTYAAQRAQLSTLAEVPLTGTTAEQRATVKRLVASLNTFFDTNVEV